MSNFLCNFDNLSVCLCGFNFHDFSVWFSRIFWFILRHFTIRYCWLIPNSANIRPHRPRLLPKMIQCMSTSAHTHPKLTQSSYASAPTLAHLSYPPRHLNHQIFFFYTCLLQNDSPIKSYVIFKMKQVKFHFNWK